MIVFIRSFATWRAVKQAAALSSTLILDSLDSETSTVTVAGTEIGQSNTGDWAIIDGLVYQVAQVKPQADRTVLTLASPLEAFSRPLELEEQPQGQTVGGFAAAMLQQHWVGCDDPVYAVPYLIVSNLDTSAYTPPELDSAGCFALSEYLRLMRKSYGVRVQFSDSKDGLRLLISAYTPQNRQVSFQDGRSKLVSADFSASGTAKLTAIQDKETGETDTDGNKITVRERSTWYLSEDGSVSQQIPPRRATGTWETVTVSGNQDVQAKVVETFAKNKANHKVEFWSEMDLTVQDACRFLIGGQTVLSYISLKRKSSTDRRFYYRSGELATTATEKLKGVVK